MIINMLLAHLVGDFVLQFDRLAAWKGRSLLGVLVHGFIVLLVTLSFTAFSIYRGYGEVSFLPWAFFIGGSHILIDVVNLKCPQFGLPAGLCGLSRFIVDQSLHLGAIAFALHMTGHFDSFAAIPIEMAAHPRLTIALAYTFMSMPAWVAIEFLLSGLLRHQAPDFSVATKHKWLGISDRWIVATAFITGQFYLILAIPLGRFTFQNPGIFQASANQISLSESAANWTLASSLGFALVITNITF